jgi:hypothetical protein
MPTTDRRRFLGTMLGAAGVAALPGGAVAETFAKAAGRFAPPAWLGPEDEAYWKLVQRQFPQVQGLTLMNAANLCPSSYAVQEMVFNLTRDMDGDASSQNRAKFNGLRDESGARWRATSARTRVRSR